MPLYINILTFSLGFLCEFIWAKPTFAEGQNLRCSLILSLVWARTPEESEKEMSLVSINSLYPGKLNESRCLMADEALLLLSGLSMWEVEQVIFWKTIKGDCLRMAFFLKWGVEKLNNQAICLGIQPWMKVGRAELEVAESRGSCCSW